MVEFATVTSERAKKQAEKSPQKLPWIRIDGPYGHLEFNIRRYECLFLAGGGVGVTPVMGIMKDLFNGGQHQKKKEKRRFIALYLIFILFYFIFLSCFLSFFLSFSSFVYLDRLSLFNVS